MLLDRLAFVADKMPEGNSLATDMNELLASHKLDDLLMLRYEELLNEQLVDGIAKLLDLPAELLKIRSKEAALRSRISTCEWELKQLHKS